MTEGDRLTTGGPDDDTSPRRTALGALVTGLAVTAFAAGLAFGTLVPALFAVVLLGLHEGARRALTAPGFQATRHLPQRAHLGDPFVVQTVAVGPPGHPVRVRDEVPAATLQTKRDAHQGRGRAEETQRLVAQHAGTIHWDGVVVEVQDPWSLWARRRRVPLRDRLKVSPEPVWARAGHLLARRAPSIGRRRSPLDFDLSPEVARVREHHPGDRVRDIDWKRTSRSDRIYVRETERRGRRPIHILVDATGTMRWARRHAKATTVLRLVYGTAALARAANLPVHLVAYHEGGVIEERIHGAEPLRRALERLAALPAPTTTRGLPDATTPRPPPSAAERRFLARTAPVVSGPWPTAAPDEAALLALTARRGDPGLVIAFLDAESDPHGTIKKVRRLVHHGHRVVVVVPPTGLHLYTRAEAEGTLLARLKDHLAARQEVVRTLRGLKVPVLLAGPGDEHAVLREVAARLE